MLHSETFEIDGKPESFHPEVRHGHDINLAIQFWTAYFARHLIRFGAFLRGTAIMLQIPGGLRYEFVLKDGNEDEIADWIANEDGPTLLDLLADCLKRLKAPSTILKEMPGGKSYQPDELTEEWADFLDRYEKEKDGLQNVVAEIIDEMIVRPEMKAIDNIPQTMWWQEWWRRIRASE